MKAPTQSMDADRDAERIERLERLSQRVKALHRWYRRAARDLPWRHTTDPYAIWVSETMLQQTQVVTVIPYYQRWLARFSHLAALAAADEGQVLLLWQGLGYYRRALNLWRAAQQLVQEGGGVVPRDPSLFRALPGVGPYTAAAVLSIAFDEPFAAIDGNVKRVLSRLVALDQPIDRSATVRMLEQVAQRLLRAPAGIHNQAMMELGATVCTPQAPRCIECPFVPACKAYHQGQPTRYPHKPRRRVVPHHHLAVAIAWRGDALLLIRRPYGGLLGGMWDLPSQPLEGPLANAEQALTILLRDQFGLHGALGETLSAIQHVYTHQQVTLHPVSFTVGDESPTHEHSLQAADRDEARWVALSHIDQYPMAKAGQKVLAVAVPLARHARSG